MTTVAFIAQSILFEVPYMRTLGPFSEVYPSVIWASWALPFVIYTQWLAFGSILAKK
jgi:hypothetical protein